MCLVPLPLEGEGKLAAGERGRGVVFQNPSPLEGEGENGVAHSIRTFAPKSRFWLFTK